MENLLIGNRLFVVLALFAVGFAVDITFIVVEGKGKMRPAVFLKGGASLFFVALACFGIAVTGGSPYKWLVAVGALLGVGGDVFLNLRYLLAERHQNGIFAIGIGSFLLGHVAYVIALALDDGFALLIAAPVALCIFLPVYFASRKLLAVPREIYPFGLFYIYCVILMFTLSAVTLCRAQGELHRVFAPGALCFMVSDLILCYQLFGRKKYAVLRPLLLVLYYFGQMMICLTPLIAG